MGLLGDAFKSLVGPVVDLFGARQQEKSQEGIHRENVALQKEFAQHGIRWKVEDAQAAGVHPLFALSGMPASYSPAIPVGSPVGEALSRMGQNLSRAVAAQETVEQRQLRLSSMEAQAARADADRAQADYWRAQAAKARQEMGGGAPMPGDVGHQGTPNVPAPFPGFYDRSKVQASPTYSRDSTYPQVSAASTPFWRAFQLRREGLMIDLPFSEEGPSESLQDLPYWMYPEVIRHNTERYGGEWLVDFLKAYPESPLGEWLRGKASVTPPPARGSFREQWGWSERAFEE